MWALDDPLSTLDRMVAGAPEDLLPFARKRVVQGICWFAIESNLTLNNSTEAVNVCSSNHDTLAINPS